MALIDKLSAIGDAIREKTGKNDLLTLDEMPAEISAIETGGGELPEEAFHIEGECQYKFSGNGWNWFLERYGNKISTGLITNAQYMFQNNTGNFDIPFDLHIMLMYSATPTFASSMFQGTAFTRYPALYIHKNNAYNDTMIQKVKIGQYIIPQLTSIDPTEQKIFLEDVNIKLYLTHNAMTGYVGKQEPSWLFDMIDWDTVHSTDYVGEFGGIAPVNWSNAYYIEEIPSFPKFYSLNTGSYYHHWYTFSLYGCYNLQRIVLPRPGPAALTSNQFASKLSSLASMKSFKFDVQEDGSPYSANWRSQTLDMTTSGFNIPNSVLDNNYRIVDDETYQRLKNEPKAWGSSYQYSVYNHNSAVETINSLPDTSAYGTNAIKFKGKAGSATDGGAINTLTEEEIAVATAKGWTVSFV